MQGIPVSQLNDTIYFLYNSIKLCKKKQITLDNNFITENFYIKKNTTKIY